MATRQTTQLHHFPVPLPVHHHGQAGQAPYPHGQNGGWTSPPSPHNLGQQGPPVMAQTAPQVFSYGGPHPVPVMAQPHQAHHMPPRNMQCHHQNQPHGGWPQQHQHQHRHQPVISREAIAGTLGAKLVPVQSGVVSQQPAPDKAMKYAAMTPEERAQQEARGRQAAAAKRCLGKTCTACGKCCVASMAVCGAMMCVLRCLTGCIPGDSPGFGGGGAGVSMSMPN